MPSTPGWALAALRAAIAARRPPPGCIHHSDRGSQYASEDYRAELAKHGLKGSMGRRGNPYDNAKAESFMKTPVVLKFRPWLEEGPTKIEHQPRALFGGR